MRAVDLIIRKRDGGRLTRDEIDWLIEGVTGGRLPDYQLSALLMAIVLRGLDARETAWLTDAMVRSGGRIDLARVPGTKVGKHSTGGVGDKTSLIVVPLAAACGVVVPKSSGRSLGHTGGTIDKLESIPGFRTSLELDEYERALTAVGCAFVSQTANLAPADKKLYALRDVTGTIESLPLIASSIMSKKIAEGTDALVLDVKVGRGAFMKEQAPARELAETMVELGRTAGLRTRALLTAMDAPLGRAVGNSLEVIECIETLKRNGPADLTELSVGLASHMVHLAGRAASFEAAEQAVRQALSGGAALDRLRRVIEFQGGDASVVDDYGRFPAASASEVLSAGTGGTVVAVDAAAVGRASMALGAGRECVGAPIDHRAGVLLQAQPGDHVEPGAPLATLFVGAGGRLDEARRLLQSAFSLADREVASRPLVLEVVG